jgi:hypothetical protein
MRLTALVCFFLFGLASVAQAADPEVAYDGSLCITSTSASCPANWASGKCLTLSAQTYTEIGTKYLGIGLHERNLAVGFRVPLSDVWPLPPNPIPRLVDMGLIYAGVWSSPSKVRFNTTSWKVITSPMVGGRQAKEQRVLVLGGTFSDWLGTAGCSINWNASAVSAPGLGWIP